MKFRQYTWDVQDSNGTSYGHVPVIVPEYTREEYNEFKEHWDTTYGTSATLLLMEETGDVTEAGEYLRSVMGIKYIDFPLTRPIDTDNWNQVWFNQISKHFKFSDVTGLFANLPITSSGTYWIESEFTINGSMPSSNIPRFDRPTANIGLARGSSLAYVYPCSRSGSGTNSLADSRQFMEISFVYIVENTLYLGEASGYYNYTPQGISGYPFTPVTYSYLKNYYLTGTYDYVTPKDPDDPDDDPYNNPGEGSFDDGSSDSIGIPSLPSLSVADTGFITLYNPSAAGLKSLANYLWSDLFSLDTFKKLFVDPMSAILGLSILPVPIPSSGSRAVTVGNVSTGVSLPVASKQFIEVDCGSFTLKRQSPGTYLDFSPYTKVDIYLPFIGTHPLNVDEVMGRSINVTYHVDILSGACTAYVKVGDSVLYQFIGSCAISVPITGNDWTQAINGVMNIAGAIGSMVMTGGATAPMVAGAVASTAVNSLKPNVEKSGAVSGAGGFLAVKRPYLIINRPNRNVAKNQNKYIGYPAWKTMTLGDLDGYNSIEDVHLKNIPATETEIAEIERLLKEGVIF